MALLISSTASLSFAPTAPIAPVAPMQRSSSVNMETIADLEARALELPSLRFAGTRVATAAQPPLPWHSHCASPPSPSFAHAAQALAKKANPVVGFWDPLGLSAAGGFAEDSTFTESEAIGWLRHAEIKHGRIAMAAFVGFIVQSNGICFPWNLQGDLPYSQIAAAGGPADQWDALPTSAKVQILGFIAFIR